MKVTASTFISNDDGFFDHLPDGPRKKRFRGIYKVDKKLALADKIEYHKAMAEKQQGVLAELEQEERLAKKEGKFQSPQKVSG